MSQRSPSNKGARAGDCVSHMWALLLLLLLFIIITLQHTMTKEIIRGVIHKQDTLCWTNYVGWCSQH